MNFNEVKVQLKQGVYTEAVVRRANELIPLLGLAEKVELVGLLQSVGARKADQLQADITVLEGRVTVLQAEKVNLHVQNQRIPEIERNLADAQAALLVLRGNRAQVNIQLQNHGTEITDLKRQVAAFTRNSKITEIVIDLQKKRDSEWAYLKATEKTYTRMKTAFTFLGFPYRIPERYTDFSQDSTKCFTFNSTLDAFIRTLKANKGIAPEIALKSAETYGAANPRPRYCFWWGSHQDETIKNLLLEV